MDGLVAYAGIVLALYLSVWAFDLAVRCVSGCPPRWLRRLAATVRPPRSRARTPLVIHELDLTRLAGDVTRSSGTDQPARAFRIRASTAAYDTVLVDACRTLGLPAPVGRPPLSEQERFDTEARLLEAGVRW